MPRAPDWSLCLLLCSLAGSPARADEEELGATLAADRVRAERGEKASAPGRRVKVTLRDGQELRGALVSESAEAVEVSISGATTRLPRGIVETIEDDTTTVRDDGQVWFPDPNRTRYFYGPSAMMLRQGELTVSQKELFFSSLNYGVTDWLSVQAGAIVPAWFLGLSGFNVIGAVKVGTPVRESLHVAGGVQALAVPGIGSRGSGFLAGFAFGTMTWGTADAHVSLSAAVPFASSSSGAQAGDALFTLSGNWRVSRSVALVTENWVLPHFSTGQVLLLDALGVRLMGEHLAVDVGGVWMEAPFSGSFNWFPVPWLDVTWNF